MITKNANLAHARLWSPDRPGPSGLNGVVPVNHIRLFNPDRCSGSSVLNLVEERNVLLQEVHHRVKNNLQVILSLLDLQAHIAQGPAPLDKFRRRIQCMAMVHEHVFHKGHFEGVDFSKCLGRLADYLCKEMGSPVRVDVQSNVEHIFLSLDTALPCALIVNELLGNALEHAFTDGEVGHIQISLTDDELDNLTLTIRDNGKGFPTDVDAEHPATLGLTIVQALLGQIDGALVIHGGTGTECQLRFHDGGRSC